MSEQANKEFFFNELPAYLDDELSGADLKRFEGMLGDAAYKDLPERFAKQKGLLQVHLQSFVIAPKDRRELIDKIQNQEVSLTVEAEKINEVGATLARSNIRRSFSLTCLVLGLCYFAYYMFSPPPKRQFKPLDALSYEAIALDEVGDGSKLALPTSSPQEVTEFFSKTPGIAFTPFALRDLPAGWQPDGAAVIDYEIAKITVAQYSLAAQKQRVFIFALNGKIEDLPAAEAVTQDGTIYRPYGTDRMNMVAWQGNTSTIVILAGRPAVKELLQLAKGAAAIR